MIGAAISSGLMQARVPMIWPRSVWLGQMRIGIYEGNTGDIDLLRDAAGMASVADPGGLRSVVASAMWPVYPE
jgi:hypothetical protein